MRDLDQSIGDLHQDEMLDDLQIREDWDQDVEDWDQDEMTVYDLAGILLGYMHTHKYYVCTIIFWSY